jgi:hypothetical protein
MTEVLAGIKPDEKDPGFRHIIMKPVLIRELDHVKAGFNSPCGMIRSESPEVRENGKEVILSEGMLDDGRVRLEKGSGSYHFTSKFNKVLF